MVEVMLIAGVSLFVALCIGELIAPSRAPIANAVDEPVPCALASRVTCTSPSVDL